MGLRRPERWLDGMMAPCQVWPGALPSVSPRDPQVADCTGIVGQHEHSRRGQALVQAVMADLLQWSQTAPDPKHHLQTSVTSGSGRMFGIEWH